ncbi:hypothetical protein ILYODFUR_002620 [Ilyodon furcidens]|uniref:Uncharacterized protein n=1 Tax=Ilyodon furcidens TaxID=33524 RepID=A0ABV0UNT6_9TELE
MVGSAAALYQIYWRSIRGKQTDVLVKPPQWVFRSPLPSIQSLANKIDKLLLLNYKNRLSQICHPLFHQNLAREHTLDCALQMPSHYPEQNPRLADDHNNFFCRFEKQLFSPSDKSSPSTIHPPHFRPPAWTACLLLMPESIPCPTSSHLHSDLHSEQVSRAM